jgi:hypothetical protein
MQSIANDAVPTCVNSVQPLAHGKFDIKKIVGWAGRFIVCPRSFASAWAQRRAHPTFIDFKDNFYENKLALAFG